MKSIYAFVFFVSTIIGVFPVLSYAQDAIDFTLAKTPYRISLASGAGLLLGQSEEIVYKGSNTDAYSSQLLWDLKPLVYLGSTLSFSRADPLAGIGAAADLSVKFGLPISSGTMEDRDWLNANPNKLTHFSSHDAYLQGALLLDISGGIAIPIKSRVTLRALLSFSFMHFSWIARDGYTQYNTSGWDASLPKTYYQGTGISYDQNWLIFSPGFGLFWPVHRVLSLDFRFLISPLIFVNDMDNHYLNPFPGKEYTQYVDKMRGGLYIEPSLDFSFTLTPSIALLVHSSWRYISGSRGDSTKTISGKTTPAEVDENQAGASYSAFDLGFFLKIALPLGSLFREN